MTTPILRLAAESDLPAINAIYNHYVAHSTATYQSHPDSLADRLAWSAHHGPAHPIIVAERADRPGDLLGWGSLSPFHPRAAFARTVENSLYVRHDCLGAGVGTLLLTRLVELAEQLGHHVVVAAVDFDQPASLALHARLGFTRVAHLREVGYKFGRWLDLIYLQRTLGA